MGWPQFCTFSVLGQPWWGLLRWQWWLKAWRFLQGQATSKTWAQQVSAFLTYHINWRSWEREGTSFYVDGTWLFWPWLFSQLRHSSKSNVCFVLLCILLPPLEEHFRLSSFAFGNKTGWELFFKQELYRGEGGCRDKLNLSRLWFICLNRGTLLYPSHPYIAGRDDTKSHMDGLHI